MMILIILTYHYQQEYIVGETERLKSLNTATRLKKTHILTTRNVIMDDTLIMSWSNLSFMCSQAKLKTP